MCCSARCCHALTPYTIKCRCCCIRCQDCDECGGDDDEYGVSDIIIQAVLDKLSNSIVKVGPNVPSPATSSESESSESECEGAAKAEEKPKKKKKITPSTTMTSLNSHASGSSSTSGISSGSSSSSHSGQTSSSRSSRGKKKGGSLRHLLPRDSSDEDEKPDQMKWMLGAANEGCAQQ